MTTKKMLKDAIKKLEAVEGLMEAGSPLMMYLVAQPWWVAKGYAESAKIADAFVFDLVSSLEDTLDNID